MTVTLRKRKSSTGKTSLYLDIYKNGKRDYEYLNLYLIPPTNPNDRKTNKENLQLAEAVRGKRLVDLQNGEYGFKRVGENSFKDFLAYFLKLTQERSEIYDSGNRWQCAYNHFKQYTNNNCSFRDLDEKLVEGFKTYLLTEKLKTRKEKLSQNSAGSYFGILKIVLKRAVQAKLISDNPATRVKNIPQEESKREYLTFEEVKKLSETECPRPYLKSAFMFSVLTGLRWSDISKMVWSEIVHSEQNGWSIIFRQQKTKGQEYLPISEQAREQLGTQGAPDERIFQYLKYTPYMNLELSRWVMNAGINKKITFHCARHTHATLLLSNGVDIYTVSKLLGHKQLKTTQIYGKIIDSKKIEAVNMLPLL